MDFDAGTFQLELFEEDFDEWWYYSRYIINTMAIMGISNGSSYAVRGWGVCRSTNTICNNFFRFTNTTDIKGKVMTLKDNILELWEKGWTIYDIAEVYNCRAEDVLRILGLEENPFSYELH